MNFEHLTCNLHKDFLCGHKYCGKIPLQQGSFLLCESPNEMLAPEEPGDSAPFIRTTCSHGIHQCPQAKVQQNAGVTSEFHKIKSSSHLIEGSEHIGVSEPKETECNYRKTR